MTHEAGITAEHLIGPRTLPAKLTGPRYLQFRRRHLSHLSGYISWGTRQRTCFLHDGLRQAAV